MTLISFDDKGLSIFCDILNCRKYSTFIEYRAHLLSYSEHILLDSKSTVSPKNRAHIIAEREFTESVYRAHSLDSEQIYQDTECILLKQEQIHRVFTAHISSELEITLSPILQSGFIDF